MKSKSTAVKGLTVNPKRMSRTGNPTFKKKTTISVKKPKLPSAINRTRLGGDYD